jgi:hypothetical protein
MTRHPLHALLISVVLILGAATAALGDDGRSAALDYLGRGTASFRAGDAAGAVQNWSAAIRIARAAGAGDIEAQALARRGEAYRVEGYFRDAGTDLRAAVGQGRAEWRPEPHCCGERRPRRPRTGIRA